MDIRTTVLNGAIHGYDPGDLMPSSLLLDERMELAELNNSLSLDEARLTARVEFVDQSVKLNGLDVFVNCIFTRCSFEGEGDIGRFCIFTDCDRIPFRRPQKCVLTNSASKEHVPN